MCVFTLISVRRRDLGTKPCKQTVETVEKRKGTPWEMGGGGGVAGGANVRL